MRRVCTKSVQVTSKQQSHFFYVDHNRSISQPSWPVKHKNKTNKARESNIMFNSSAAGWFWWAAFSSCYPQTRWHVRGVEQRPHPTKHKDLLLYCYSTVKASLAHPHFPGALTRAGWRRGCSTVNQCGFVVLSHRTPSVATVAATSSIVEVSASHLALQQHAKAMISTLNPQCFTHQTFQCPQSTTTGALSTTSTPPGLQTLSPLLEVQKLFVDTQADRSTPSTSFSSSSLPIQASTLRRFCHATNRPWKGWTGAGCASRGIPRAQIH